MGSGMSKAAIKVAQTVGLEEKKEERRPVLPGEVEKSIAMGRSSLIRNQKKAIVNLFRLSKDSDRIRNQIIEEGGIMPLIQMYRSKSPEVQLLSIKTIAELAKTTKNRVTMLENGACTPVLDALKHKRYEVREAGIHAVSNLGEYDEAKKRIVADGATPGIIKFLAEGYKDNSLEAEITGLTAALKLSQTPANHTRMVRDNILPTLFEFVHSPLKSNKHKSIAMQTLAELCKHENNHKRIVDLSDGTGTQRIIALCGYYDDAVRIHAAEAVEHLAVNPILVQKLAQEGVVKPLKDMLKTNKHHAVLRSVKALCALAQDPENQKMIVRENMIPHLLKKSNCGVDEIETTITRCLALLSKSNVNRPKILFHGGFKPLMYTAQYGQDPDLKKESNDVLTNLFKLPGAKRDELVRRAAEKFRDGMGKRGDDTFGGGAVFGGGMGGGGLVMGGKNNKHYNAAGIIFGQGGNDDDSSSEED